MSEHLLRNTKYVHFHCMLTSSQMCAINKKQWGCVYNVNFQTVLK